METYATAMQFVTHALIAGFCGLFGTVIAHNKGRPRWLGFLLGAVALLPGWIILWLIPAKRDRHDSTGTPTPSR